MVFADYLLCRAVGFRWTASAFNESKDSAAAALAVIGLGIALLLFGAHLWYAFYTLMLLPWFTFLPAIPELNFWGIYIAFALLRGGISTKSK